MSERAEHLLKRFCLVLALLLIYPVVRLALRDDGLKQLPLAFLTLPAVASNAASTNRQAQPKTGETNSLPDAIRIQVERVTQSEILGPVIRPQPVALLGIAGKDAFLRSPNGRTGLIRVGEQLDGVTLLQVGTNRVLIELDGKRRELIMFAGLGSETLLPKEKEKKP